MIEANHVHITPDKVGRLPALDGNAGAAAPGREFKPNQQVTGGTTQVAPPAPLLPDVPGQP